MTGQAHFPLNLKTLNSDHSGIVLHPSSVLADPVTLTMAPSDDGTPCLSLSDEEVEFKGFGKTKPRDSSTDTVPDLVCEELDDAGGQAAHWDNQNKATSSR